MKNYTIAVAGTGYVGLSIATLLSQHHQVTAVDVIPEKVEKINNRISPIQDEYIEKYLAEKELNLKATLDGAAAYKNADFVVIAAPTNYDPVKNYFDTSHVEEVIDLVLEVNPDAVMVIKSTIPVGYCRSLYVKYAKVFRGTPACRERSSTCCSRRSSCGKARRCMTTCIRAGSSWAIPNRLKDGTKRTRRSVPLPKNIWRRRPENLQSCFRKERSSRTWIRCSWA